MNALRWGPDQLIIFLVTNSAFFQFMIQIIVFPNDNSNLINYTALYICHKCYNFTVSKTLQDEKTEAC